MERSRGYSDQESEDSEDSEEWKESERKLARRGYGQQQSDRGSSYQKVEAHQIFRHARLNNSVLEEDALEWSRPRIPLNLIAYDGHGRLYVWDSEQKRLHFVEIQRSDLMHSFGGDSGALLARIDTKTVQLSSPVDFQVLHLAINRTGRSLALVGDGSLMVVNLLTPSSTSSSGVCRIQKIGADGLFSRENGQWLRILQVDWHPYSDSHLGVLSSDGCFRLFDLSLDTESAEQEYHLQPSSPKKPGFSPLVRAIAFSFGREHLWDRFTVFLLYNDGSLYALCPIVPFGGMFNAAAVEDLAKYHLQNIDSPSSTASENSSLGAAWLEAVFPGLSAPATPSLGESLGGSLVLKAHAYVPLDASLHLQGPFEALSRRVDREDGHVYLEQADIEPFHAVGLLYSVVNKDSILAVATQDGQVQLYVLADEIEPTWSIEKPPRITVDDKGHILAVGMLVEASDTIKPLVIGREEELKGTWPGRIPPLLRLPSVDLALQPTVLEAGPVVLFADPVVPERLYCQHSGGIDAILLKWLPFSVQSANEPSTGSPPPPAVFPLLDICPTGFTVPRPLLGAVLILDSLGESWIVAVTSNCECAVVNMKPQRSLPEPLVLEESASDEEDSGVLGMGVFQMMSKELLLGPKDIPLTQLTSMGAPLTTDSIEGRAFLHDQCKLLHEKYIEYSHRVYVELTSHLSRLYDIVHEQKRQVKNAELRLSQAQRESTALNSRVQEVMMKNRILEQRVKRCCTLPGVSERPLTATEKELKLQLDNMRFQDLDILNSAVETLSVRAERLLSKQNVLSKISSPYQNKSNRGGVPDSQMRRLKVAVEHLSNVVEESTQKVKVIDESVSHRELLKDR